MNIQTISASKFRFILYVTIVFILSSYSVFAMERKEYIYTDLNQPHSSDHMIIVQENTASFTFSFHGGGNGSACDSSDELICLSLPGWFTFAFPRDTEQWNRDGIKYDELTYRFGDYRYQIANRRLIDWDNNGEMNLHYYIDAFYKSKTEGSKEELWNRFIFSCEEGLKIVSNIAKIEGGKYFDEPYREMLGEIPSMIMRPIGNAFGAGQCTS